VPTDFLVQLATIGGGFFAAGCMLLVARAAFDAWRRGELVSRPVHDAIVAQLMAENAALRQDVRESAHELARLASAYEALSRR